MLLYNCKLKIKIIKIHGKTTTSCFPKYSRNTGFRALSEEQAIQALPYAYAMKPYEDMAALSRKFQAKEPDPYSASASGEVGQLPVDKSDQLRTLEIFEERNSKLGEKAIIAFAKGEKFTEQPYSLSDANNELKLGPHERKVAIGNTEKYKRNNKSSVQTVDRLRRFGYRYTTDKIEKVKRQEYEANRKKTRY